MLFNEVNPSSLIIGTHLHHDLFTGSGIKLASSGSEITRELLEHLKAQKNGIFARPPARPASATGRLPQVGASNRPPTDAIRRPRVEIIDVNVKRDDPSSVVINSADTMLAVNELVNNRCTISREWARNKRSDARYPLEQIVGLGAIDSRGTFAEVYKTWGMDISNQGLGLFTDRPIALKTKLVIALMLDQNHRLLVPAEVVRCRCLVASIHAIGVYFIFKDVSFKKQGDMVQPGPDTNPTP